MNRGMARSPLKKTARKSATSPMRVTTRKSIAVTSARDATVGETTYRRVRADIVLGRLARGQKLTLGRMRGAYGTAVSTLRELLTRLASEGLILAEGSRGFEVAAISAQDLREV